MNYKNNEKIGHKNIKFLKYSKYIFILAIIFLRNIKNKNKCRYNKNKCWSKIYCTNIDEIW